MSEIPEPPLGSQRDLFRRADGMYGADDYICWPQPFNSKYAFVAAIPTCPKSSTGRYFADLAIWDELSERDLASGEEGLSGRGIVRGYRLDSLKGTLERLAERLGSFRAASSNVGDRKGVLVSLNEFEVNLRVCFTEIRDTPMLLRDAKRGWAEIRRAWLSMMALMDYVEIYSPRMNGLAPRASAVEECMGACIWDARMADMLFRAGLPVYYIRSTEEFRSQNILSVCTLRRPLPPLVCLTQASPPYHIIYRGQAGADDKFHSIIMESVHTFSKPSPFSTTHYPHRYDSSWTLGAGPLTSPISSASSSTASSSVQSAQVVRKQKTTTSKSPYNQQKRRPQPGKGVGRKLLNTCSCLNTDYILAPATERNPFAELPSTPYTPDAIPTWSGVNLTINQNSLMPGTVEVGKRTYIFPDPGLFFGTTHYAHYFHHWLQFREAWTHKCRTQLAEPVTPEVWRKILINVQWNERDTPSTAKQAETHRVAQLIKDVMQSLDARLSVESSQSPSLDIAICREAIWELCQINFRYELQSLDDLLDQSKPQRSANLTVDQYERAITNHRRQRIQQISTCFFFEDIFSPGRNSAKDSGLASSIWRDRYATIKSWWSVMDSWSPSKPVNWRDGISVDLTKVPVRGEEWEHCVIRYYVQSFYDIFRRPPVLPRRH